VHSFIEPISGQGHEAAADHFAGAQQRLLGVPGPEPFEQEVGVELDADGVVGKRARAEPLIQCLRGGEVLDLQFGLHTVRIAEVHGRGGAMVDAPLGRQAVALEPLEGVQQIGQRTVGEGHVVQPRRLASLRGEVVRVDEGHPVMLVVIGQEAQQLVAEHHLGSQHDAPPVNGLLVVSGGQDDVGQFLRRLCVGIGTGDGKGSHRIGHCIS
jgi:hypothetical protein